MTSPYNTPDTPDTVAPTTPDVASANPTLPISTTPQQTYVQQAAVASPQATSPIAHQPVEAYPAFGTYNTFVNWSSTEGATGKPTDSAAAGTAMATGHKTLRGVIGMDIFNRL